MDVTKMLEAVLAASSNEIGSRTMTLGQLIEQFEKCKPDSNVTYAFGDIRPNTISSWRGVYSQLAINYVRDDEQTTVADMLAILRGALGNTYDGYKGGTYRMTASTPVWVSNWGRCEHLAITGIVEKYGHVTINTEIRED